MRYFIDSEFMENGVTIEPISLAVVSEAGGEFYVEFEFDESHANEFVRTQVIPRLRGDAPVSKSEAARHLLEFTRGDDSPEFWAWYGAYDWVLICQLFGTMMDLPSHFPMFVRDLRQTIAEAGIPREVLPPIPSDAHDALVDARWLRDAYRLVARATA